MSLIPTIQTLGRLADVAAVTDAYSETKLFEKKFKDKLVASRYRPNAVTNIKEKLGERLLDWWQFIVNERPDKLNDDPAELRKEIMKVLRNYEIYLKTRSASVVAVLPNNADEVADWFENKWMYYVRQKYLGYLANMETQMQTFMEDICCANIENIGEENYVDIMELLGLEPNDL